MYLAAGVNERRHVRNSGKSHRTIQFRIGALMPMPVSAHQSECPQELKGSQTCASTAHDTRLYSLFSRILHRYPGCRLGKISVRWGKISPDFSGEKLGEMQRKREKCGEIGGNWFSDLGGQEKIGELRRKGEKTCMPGREWSCQKRKLGETS
jgi:hypothetical protein